MSEFSARSVEFKGRFVVPAPIETVFDLFSPLGERNWVPDWNPRNCCIHPASAGRAGRSSGHRRKLGRRCGS
jgi:hypothetical protein